MNAIHKLDRIFMVSLKFIFTRSKEIIKEKKNGALVIGIYFGFVKKNEE